MNPEDVDGWMSSAELIWLADQASRRQRIVEFGSYKGRSTLALARATPGVVYAVDWWPGEMERTVMPVFLGNLYEEIKSGRVVVCRHPTSAMPVLVPPADMVFIDADHSYEHVAQDIYIAQKLMTRGGLLCGHDYAAEFPGVIRAVTELVPGVAIVPGTSIWYKEVRV